MTFNLADLLTLVAAAVPDNEALVCNEQRRTFAQLVERSERLARWLRARGVGAGDKLGILSSSCPEWIETCFAAFFLRAVPVNVNYRYTADECRYIFENADIQALLFHADLEEVVRTALPTNRDLKALLRVGKAGKAVQAVDYDQAMLEGGPPLGELGRSDDDLILLYTGGTTGFPKGVMWTHKAVFLGPVGGAGRFSPDGPIQTPEQITERVLVSSTLPFVHLPCPPLMHGAAFWNALIGLLAGQKVVLQGAPSFDAERILDLIDREGVSSVFIIGDAMALPLCEALERAPGRWSLDSLFLIVSSGALFSEHLRDRLAALVPESVTIMNAMGSSESGTTGIGEKPQETGVLQLQPDPLNAVVVDGRFAQPGETGILARTGHLPLGYYKDPQKTAQTFVTIEGNRYVIVGDIARLESDGTVTIFGRGSQCINSGGEKVYSEEVEEAVRSATGVRDAIVVGIADPRWGQKVVALVAMAAESGRDSNGIKAHCRQRLAGYKVPKDVLFVESVKRSPAGKADYSWARQAAESALRAAELA